MPFPGLSDARRGGRYLLVRIDAALNGIDVNRNAVRQEATAGRTCENLIPTHRELPDLRAMVRDGSVTKIVARAALDDPGGQNPQYHNRGLVMTTYPEKKLTERVALYRGDYRESLGLEDFIADADHVLSGRGDYGPLNGLDYAADGLIRDSMANFALGVMERREADGVVLDLAQRCRFFSFAVEKAIFDGIPQSLSPGLHKYGEWLLQFIATGRSDPQAALEEIALSVVKSGRYAPTEGGGDYFTTPSKLGVFALEMLAALRDETIDWQSFHIPPDPFWLDCARIGLTEPDPLCAADWVRQLCEAHVQTLQTDKDNFELNAATGHEIEQEAHFLWPITVHAFLRLRGILGLETAPIDHPLMQTSFDVLRNWTVSTGSWPAEPWFAEILTRTEVLAPALRSQFDLIR